jgi:hypothetical protein
MTTTQGQFVGERASRVGLCARLLVALALGACGGDGRAPGLGADDAEGDAGRQDPMEGDSGALDPNADGGGAAVDGGEPLPAVECDEGEQDHDRDGSCSPACSDSVDCGHGSCVDSSGATLCVCDAGFAGEACDACAEGTAGDACDECLAGYVPSTLFAGTCIADPCQAVECGNHGSCVVVDDEDSCGCERGWNGDTCNVCADGYAGAACDSCDAGWSNVAPVGELECIPDVCVTTDCGHGTCTFEAPATAVCECDTGYTGDGTCDSCASGYLAKGELCVLELPVVNDMLTLHLDMMANGTYLAGPNKEVLLWRSDTPGGGEKNAVYEGETTSAPTVVKANGLTMLDLDGSQHLRLPGVELGAASYTVFVAMNPDSAGGAEMAAFAVVGSSSPNKHGVLIRSEGHGTKVRYLHRAPIALSGGNNVNSNIDDPGALDPFQIITAERRLDANDMMMQMMWFDTFAQDTVATDPELGAAAMDLFIGMQAAAGGYKFTGRIGEIVVYNGEITEDERRLVRAYLKAKWVPKLRQLVQ